MPARKSIDEQLAALDTLEAEPDAARKSAALEAALGERHYRVVAKAAKLAADALAYELEPALLAAYRRLLDKPVKSDPSCFAKKAIVRALVELDCTDTAFFLEALRYRQPEPVWGGSVDTAVDVRSSSAMGLVATGYPRALVELTALLEDPEADARAGAARAIACGNPREAEILLRAKVLAGDTEPAVIGECFAGLLSVEPDESPTFVAGYLGEDDRTLAELAALTLGESRLDAALDHLTHAWDGVHGATPFNRVLVRAVAVHRSDAAFDWLARRLEDAEPRLAEEILDALAVYRRNARVAERLEATLAKRGEAGLQDRFERLWKAD